MAGSSSSSEVEEEEEEKEEGRVERRERMKVDSTSMPHFFAVSFRFFLVKCLFSGEL